MTLRMTFRAQAFGLSLVLLVPAATPAQNPTPTPRPPARVYTNADLERVHPHADDTGVSSVPAVAAPDGRPERASEPRRPSRGETHWRAEAARVRERLRALEERAGELRAKIAERASQPQVFGRRSTTPRGASLSSLEASLAAVELRERRLQEDLEERARREGALPGWLR
jgi:hypothetical protein